MPPTACYRAAWGRPEGNSIPVTDTTTETVSGDHSPAGQPDAVASADGTGLPRAGTSAGLKRWLLAVLAAAGVGLPIGWLLCYGGLLPFFLGLFFFLLFGLLLGAVAYRVGLAARPLTKAAIVAGAAVVVVVTWATSILVEARDFPDQVAGEAIEQHRKLPEGMTPQTFRRQSADQIAAYLRERHPPGGVTGYVRWALSSSRVNPPAGMLRRPFKSSQPRGWWAGRVILSIILLFYGVYSQIGPLTRPPSAKDQTSTAVNPLSKI